MSSSTDILKLLSDATAEVVEKASPSVVSVSSIMGGGTGVIWSSEGHIITCSHVIRKQSRIRVGLPDGSSTEAKVLGIDPYSDVALLKIRGEALKPIELGDSEYLSTGQFVLAIARPFSVRPSAASGIIPSARSSLRGMHGMNLENVIVTDVRLNPGYSGGPLIDASGRMIGINAAYAWSRGLAIPVNTVKGIVERVQKGTIKRGYLGITSHTIQLPLEIVDQEKMTQNGGAIVLSVETGSPARRAGLAIGDIIVSFNDKPVTDACDLPRLLSEDVAGKETKIKILRGEKPAELKVTPAGVGEND